MSDDESVDPRLGHAPRKRLRSQTTSDTLAGQDDWDSSEIQVVVSTPDQSGANNSLLPASRSGSTVPRSVNRQRDAAEISERPNPEAASAASDEVETVNIIRRRVLGDLTAGYASDAQQSGERFRVIDGKPDLWYTTLWFEEYSVPTLFFFYRPLGKDRSRKPLVTASARDK